MKTVNVVYWTGSGNTEQMANLIADSAKEAGAEVSVINVSDADASSVLESDVLVLGCPSMGDEVLEESEFEPFMESIESNLTGKAVALFGSYGWGDGQWMRDWEQRVKQAGGVIVAEPVIVQDAPDGDGQKLCKKLGVAIIA